MTTSRGARIPTTLFARMVGLLVLMLLASQIVGGVLFFLVTPPPRPAIVHVSEIAQVLREARDEPAALRQDLPDGVERRRLSAIEPILAAQMGVDPSDVRLWRGEGPPGSLMGAEDRTRLDPVVLGGYGAALRQPDGWLVIRRGPHGPGDLIVRMSLWLAVTLACIVPVAVLLGARLSAPISAFAEAAERLGRDPYAAPMRPTGPAEVVVAINAFNEMQARLRAYVDERVRMVGAIAHDLRTPLTRLRLQLDALPPTARARAEADFERMDQMVQGALAFVKDASVAPERTPLHLLSLVEAVAEDMDPGGERIQVVPGPDAVVCGDEAGLRRLVGNLLSNAMRYGRRATCRVLVEPGWALLQIDDEGPGLDPADLERAFEPYVRLADDNEGIGLGLSIVRGAARAHRGEATLENLPQGGLRAEVRLPLASEEGAR